MAEKRKVSRYELSGGMQQRVALARALINYPKVLLFDEPFGALDAFTRMKMHDELLKIKESTNITMVMVTHDVEEAVYLADRVFTMTPRPAILKKIVAVDLPRPRNRDSKEFIEIKEEILDILNFTA
ncbi:ATP-binding cassette domain-containing protein [Sporolactobacillus shoreicorticis]|uniref:ABC transporter ATP-binding protein n=1 Tax=Sporolactobacillus shoreicorticis TaxID=1923877 RepID=A0ABW5S701_9BACL|nr:ATP-binding cassette domain-containing protein [Sporolactobacillus shoreicorticis]MCO7124353.1 ATP-binding cassette domain-containing protein [Sporolactobacillus shoreicorticis]